MDFPPPPTYTLFDIIQAPHIPHIIAVNQLETLPPDWAGSNLMKLKPEKAAGASWGANFCKTFCGVSNVGSQPEEVLLSIPSP